MKVVAADGFHLGIGEGDYGSTNTYRTLYPEIWIDNGGGVPPSYYTFQAGTIPLGQWAQLTLLWSQSGLFQGSVNGQIVQSQTISTGSLGTGGDPIILGVDQDLASYPLDGLPGPVTIGVSNDPTVYTADWPLDEGSGTTVYDASGNGNNGKIAGSGWTWSQVSSGPA